MRLASRQRNRETERSITRQIKQAFFLIQASCRSMAGEAIEHTIRVNQLKLSRIITFTILTKQTTITSQQNGLLWLQLLEYIYPPCSLPECSFVSIAQKTKKVIIKWERRTAFPTLHILPQQHFILGGHAVRSFCIKNKPRRYSYTTPSPTFTCVITRGGFYQNIHVFTGCMCKRDSCHKVNTTDLLYLLQSPYCYGNEGYC